uniref:Protein Smaug 2 n=1 Tax=Schistosoma haematobium TaxID=6185 RepID=A0A095AMB1_SCHHA
MSSAKASVSQCNVTSIPTICLDNNLELGDGCDSGLGGKSEDEFYVTEEQAFGINVRNDLNLLLNVQELYYFSRLSCINSHKKFLIAIVLLSQCDEGYRCAAQQWLNNTIIESKEDLDQVFININDSDHLKKLRATSASTNELLDILKNLTSLSGLQYNNEAYRFVGHDSAPVKPEMDIFNSNTRTKNMFGDSLPDADVISNNFQSIKRQYLELVSNKFVSSLATDCDSIIKGVDSNHVPLREAAVQTSIGQLFIATILHTSFNEDDRKWLLSSIRNKYKGLSKETSTLVKQGPTDDGLCSKLFDCLIDLGLDLSCALQRITSDSSSHSLTSSGFLSGCGGSDSQYDLLMEASNSGSHSGNHNNGMNTTKANYGALLTVPNAEVKSGLSNNFYSNHPYCPYPLSTSSHFSYRRLSDIPRVSNYHSLHSSQYHTQISSNNNDQENKTSEIADLGTNQNFFTTKDFNDLTTVSSSSPLTSIRNSIADTNCGKTNVSSNVIHQQRVSTCTLSDSSSISSSNTDLGVCIPHSPTSIFLTSTSPELVKSRENIVTYTSDSSLQFPTGANGQTVSDNRESLSNQRSDFVNDHYPSSQTHLCQQLHDHFSPNFPEVQDKPSHSIIPRNSNKLINSTDMERNTYCVTDENNFLNPSSGMTAVPFWLKSLRLHKYASLFQNLSYEKMMNITDDWLKEQNVTQGARNKILLSIEKLKHRKSTLCLIEKCLSDIRSTDQLTQTMLHSCLTEIKHILFTPIKPCHETIKSHSLHLNQFNCCSCSCSPTASSSSICSSIPRVSMNSDTSTTKSAITITDSTCPITVSPPIVSINTAVYYTRNALVGNNYNDCGNCSSINSMNNKTNDPNISNYYCFCHTNALYAENKCYLNVKQSQSTMMSDITQVFNDNKCWSPSITNILPNVSYEIEEDGKNGKLHSSTLSSNFNNELIRSNQNECGYTSDECVEQKRINDVDNMDNDNIPGHIIACLTKVCSSLLVTAYPSVNLYEEFLQILEIILNHVAFTEQQKKLVSFWKHRIIVVYGQYVTHSSNSSKPKSDFHSNIYPRHIPLVNHPDTSRLRKLPTTFVGQEQRLGSHMGHRTFHANTLIPTVCLHNTQDTSYFTQDASDADYARINMSLNIPSTIEASRRHSASVGDSRNCLAVERLNNRRRMPSPNSSCFSGRGGMSVNLPSNNSSFSHHLQASSDMELSGFPSQLPKPRFHSPSRFDPSTSVTPRRNLMPVATAPVTRMPSPSDVCRHGICYNDWFSNNRGAFPTAPSPSSVSPISLCEGSCPENVTSDTQIIQQLPRTPNVPTSILPYENAFHKTYSSCLCTPTNKATTPHTLLPLSSPNHLKSLHQHIFPNYCENSGSFLTSNYPSIPCIPNPIVIGNVYHTFGSSFGESPSQSVCHSNCSTTISSSQQTDSKLPGISCWSTDPYSHQINRRQTEYHEMPQCMHNIYDLNNDNTNDNNSSNNDLLVFVDNYIATAENNMIGDPSDSSNDRINRDLDLLTRKVTEHAIGGMNFSCIFL